MYTLYNFSTSSSNRQSTERYRDSYSISASKVRISNSNWFRRCKNITLQFDNVELRGHINTRGQKPIHADDNYVPRIQHLNKKTKS